MRKIVSLILLSILSAGCNDLLPSSNQSTVPDNENNNKTAVETSDNKSAFTDDLDNSTKQKSAASDKVKIGVKKNNLNQPASKDSPRTEEQDSTKPIKLTTIRDGNQLRTVDQKGRAVLALVNGKAIYMQKVWDQLTDDFGLPIAQQLIADEVVKQAMKKLNLNYTVTPAEIDEESKDTIVTSLASHKITPQNALNVLPQILKERGLTMRQWETTMARNIRLSRIAEKKVKVTEEMLKQAYFYNYGGRHKVNQIRVNNILTANKISKELKAGKNFAALAKKYSSGPNAKTGGQYAEVSIGANPQKIPIQLWRAAMMLKKVGETTIPIKDESSYVILELAEIIPPKSDVTYETAKPDLECIVRENLIRNTRHQILAELMSKAKIEFKDPTVSGLNLKARLKAKEEEQNN